MTLSSQSGAFQPLKTSVLVKDRDVPTGPLIPKVILMVSEKIYV